MEQETSKDFENISIETRGLDTSKFVVQASSQSDAAVTVSVRGVKSLLDKLEASSINAYIDLSDITEPGAYSVPVYVDGTDLRLGYTSRTKNVKIIILNKP